MTSIALRSWLASAAHRYSASRSQLLYASCAYYAARSSAPSAAELHRAMRIVWGDQSFSLSSVRAALSQLAMARGSGPSLSAPRAAAARTLALVMAPHDGVAKRRQGIVRRALAVIGMTSIAEAQRCETMQYVIVSSRWLALRLGVTQQGALQVVNVMKSAGLLTSEKLLRDQRTRAFKLRVLSHAERLAAELAWADDVSELLAFVTTGAAPTAGSVADVVAGADSAVWLHEGTPGGAWTQALREAMLPRAKEARTVGRDVAAALGTRRGRQIGRELESLAGWPSRLGSPQKSAVARAWLAERPADRPMVEWVAEVAEGSGAAAAAAERKAAADAARRANRRAADAATGGVRSYRTPEETAVAVLQRIGDRPADLDEAQGWLGQVADAWGSIGDRATLAQRAAMREAVRRVLVGAGMADDRAQVAADRVTGARMVERVAA